MNKKFKVMKTTETNIIYCLISTSEIKNGELAARQWPHPADGQLAEVTNAFRKLVLIFKDNNWHSLKQYDKNTLIDINSGMLFDKTDYKWVGCHN